MAKKYTLEDVETLRNKAGVSYEEAVELLDKYDGDTARALIELEKRGRLGDGAQGSKINLEDIWTKVKQLWKLGLVTRVRVEHKGEMLVNLSASFLILMLLLGAWAVIAAAVIALVSGCAIRIQTPPKEDSVHPAAEQTAAHEDDDDDDFPGITIR
jgi:hypothetical protein